MFGCDPVFTADVKCPVCGNTWSEYISADLEGVQCLQCRTWLEIKAKFTLVNPVQKTIDITKIKKPSSKNVEQAKKNLRKMGHII